MIRDECAQELNAVTAQGGEERRKTAQEIETLQQSLKLHTIKTTHLEDQIQELKTCQKVSQ